jgi:hypothetical protein
MSSWNTIDSSWNSYFYSVYGHQIKDQNDENKKMFKPQETKDKLKP